MNKYQLLTVVACFLLVAGCRKKNYPSKNAEKRVEDSVALAPEKSDSAKVTKAVVKRKPKVPVAKVITVDDNAAHKSVDGRLYYDVLGRRYWKNYKDGKYYLFNKSMYNDPAFKKPG